MSGSNTPAGDSDSTKSVDEQFDKALTYSIISSILGLVALVVVVIIIVRCLRKAGKSISINYNAPTPNNTPPPMEVAMQVIPDSQLEMAMMEKFIHGIAREKPIRFSPHQLANFTRNYTTRLGSGGYGVVYKGAFPNGVQIAVKVLNGRSNEVVEEQFCWVVNPTPFADEWLQPPQKQKK